MNRRPDDPEDPRRRLLVQALSLGALAAAVPMQSALAVGLFGEQPRRLPAGRSIYRMRGAITVNGKRADESTLIRAGDTLETAPEGELVFALESGQAMILRGGSRLTLEAEKQKSSLLLTGLRLLSGKLLTVTRNSHLRVTTPTAAMGIRGTGFYVEADPELTYFCTCYGSTEVAALDDPHSRTTVVSKHHDRPLYIGKGRDGNAIQDAPFINHTDQELALIEALVGRTVPFVFENDAYSAPRREY